MKIKEIVTLIRKDDKAISINGKLIIKTGKQDAVAADVLEMIYRDYSGHKMGEVSDALDKARLPYLTCQPLPYGSGYTLAAQIIKDTSKMYPNLGKKEMAEAFDTTRWWLIFLASIKRTG